MYRFDYSNLIIRRKKQTNKQTNKTSTKLYKFKKNCYRVRYVISLVSLNGITVMKTIFIEENASFLPESLNVYDLLLSKLITLTNIYYVFNKYKTNENLHNATRFNVRNQCKVYILWYGDGAIFERCCFFFCQGFVLIRENALHVLYVCATVYCYLYGRTFKIFTQLSRYDGALLRRPDF